jgi:ABC-type transport system substrate-binding protein
VPPENGGQWGLSKAELSQIPGYNPDHAKDLAIAQQKFRESGIDPKTVELELVYSTFFGPLGDLMATVLSELGMKVKASALAAADLGKRRLDGAFDLSHHTPGFSLDDPSDQYSSIVITGGLTNFGKYSNSRMDQLLEAQDAELDTAKRRALLVEVQRIHLSEFPTAPFFWSANVRGSRPEVRGHLVPLLSITSAHRLEGVWLER